MHELFNPHDVTWTPVSRGLRTVRWIVFACCWLPCAASCLLVAALLAHRWMWVVVAVLLPLTLAWGMWLIHRQVAALAYAERHEDFLVRRGVMFRKLTVVPYGRMQYVDVQAGPVERMVKLATVQLHTAAPGVDASIPGLGAPEAARLRERLASLGEAKLVGL